MSWITRIEKWGDAHHPKWLDGLRIILGIIIFWKGIEFINNMDALSELINRSGFLGTLAVGLLAHYIVFVHLLGGIMIIFGMLTRSACLSLIPILVGAVIFVFIGSGDIFKPHSELWMTLLILFLLISFAIEGSGPLSFDGWLRSHPGKPEWKPKDED